MSDYVQTTDFSAKDALTTGDPNKKVLGAELDTEFSAISTAIATKLDGASIASQAQAQSGSANDVLMTPLRVEQWGSANGGLVADIRSLADPGADRFLFWDDSAGAAAFLTAGSGLSISGTTVSVVLASASDYDANEHVDHSAVSISAGDGLTGGGTIAANRTLAVDSTVVRTSGAQTLAGVKTFSSSPVVPTPSGSTDAANKSYVDSQVSGGRTYGGKVDSAATGETVPSGWSVAKDSTGRYTITHNLGTTNYCIVCMRNNEAAPGRIQCSTTSLGSNSCQVNWYNQTDTTYTDVDWQFILKVFD